MIDTYQSHISRLSADYALASRGAKQETEALRRITAQTEATSEAQAILQAIAQSLQQQAHEQIASVVTRCLNTIFDDPYEFRIEFERKRGKTEARLVFIRNGLELDDPLNEVGGGVIDVAAFALRLAAILLSRPLKRRLVVLDEPFKNIRGEGNKERTRRMLVELAGELGIQFIINTEIRSYQLGTVVKLGDE